MKIGSAQVKEGHISKGTLKVAEYPDGTEISVPVMVACGKRNGSTLWVQSCVHGSEVVGPLSSQKFLTELNISELEGTVVFCLAVNPLAYRTLTRCTPHDGMNLNSLFPGSESGSVSEQIAARCFEAAQSMANAVLDLHSGGNHLVCAHHVLYCNSKQEETNVSKGLAQNMGASHVLSLPGDQLIRSAIRSFSDAGVPAVIVESGGGAQVTTEDIENHVMAIQRGCHFLGLLGAGAGSPSGQVIHGRIKMIRTTRGGIFCAMTKPGEYLREGDDIGYLVNIYGEITEVYRCSSEQAWVAAVRRPYMPAMSGDDVAELFETEST